jgi:hypothetical protein
MLHSKFAIILQALWISFLLQALKLDEVDTAKGSEEYFISIRLPSYSFQEGRKVKRILHLQKIAWTPPACGGWSDRCHLISPGSVAFEGTERATVSRKIEIIFCFMWTRNTVGTRIPCANRAHGIRGPTTCKWTSRSMCTPEDFPPYTKKIVSKSKVSIMHTASS